MGFSVKVDEDLPKSLQQILTAMGYEASTVIEQRMNGWPDVQLWQAIQSEGRFLITANKGFGDIRRYPPGQHAGVLVLRPDEDGIRPVLELMQMVLSRYQLADLAQTVTIVTPHGIRIRRAMI